MSLNNGVMYIVTVDDKSVVSCKYNSNREWFEPDYGDCAIPLRDVLCWELLNDYLANKSTKGTELAT